MNLSAQEKFEDAHYEKFEEENKQQRKRKSRARPVTKIDNISVRTIQPLTYSQEQFFNSFADGYHIVARGSAGSGKTFLATYLALKELFAKNVDHIIFLRSIVATRDVGFLPGNLEEKSQPFWELYKDHVNDLCESGTAWDSLHKKGFINFETTSFMRGKTWNNAVVIIDEVQNNNRGEIYTALTRIGNNSRVIICGDNKQTDLTKKENAWDYLTKLIDHTTNMFDTITFTNRDIVRSDFVKQIIIADEEIE